MRNALLALAGMVSACSWTPVAMYSHVSQPDAGPPFNSECDDVSDFGGFGAGQAWGKTRVYITGGVKRFRVCLGDGLPAEVRHEPAASLLVIQELHRSTQ